MDEIRHPIDELAEEFLERLRAGARPTIDEYAHEHPEFADEIRDLFPALEVLEQGKPNEDAEGDLSFSVDGMRPQVLGDYRIIREVGRGGMGIVCEAEQVSLGRHVALKLLPPHVAKNVQALFRFRREARSAARLHHTNIVPVFEIGHHQGLHFYAMQFIHGQGLDEVITELSRVRRRAASGDLPHTPFAPSPSLATDLAGQLLSRPFEPPPSQDRLSPQPAIPQRSDTDGDAPLVDSVRHVGAATNHLAANTACCCSTAVILITWLVLACRLPMRWRMPMHRESSIETSSRRMCSLTCMVRSG